MRRLRSGKTSYLPGWFQGRSPHTLHAPLRLQVGRSLQARICAERHSGNRQPGTWCPGEVLDVVDEGFTAVFAFVFVIFFLFSEIVGWSYVFFAVGTGEFVNQLLFLVLIRINVARTDAWATIFSDLAVVDVVADSEAGNWRRVDASTRSISIRR